MEREVHVELIADRPAGGMWHTGPNPFWLTATHIPTGASVTLYSGEKSQHKVRADAYQLLALAVEVAGGETPKFVERLGGLVGAPSPTPTAKERG